jgi:hypothetical protein
MKTDELLIDKLDAYKKLYDDLSDLGQSPIPLIDKYNYVKACLWDCHVRLNRIIKIEEQISRS